VTVLFADVVHSMDIAAAVRADRLREIMTDLVNRAAVVVQRYGGTVGSFTGDGIAVFSAPRVGGSRFPRLPGGVGHTRGGEAAAVDVEATV
jgi:class 3 adenylate cyclase